QRPNQGERRHPVRALGRGHANRHERDSTSGDRDLDQLVGLDHVAFLHVVVVLQVDAALEAGTDLAYVVLEAPQAGDGALVDFLAAADEARLRTTADHAVQHVRAGDVAGARDLDDLPNLGPPERALFGLRFDLATDHALHVFDQLVDDPVALERDALTFRRLDDATRRVHAERHHRRAGGSRQQQVGLGGGADFGQHDVDVHLFGSFGLAQDDALDGLERALGVGPDEQ